MKPVEKWSWSEINRWRWNSKTGREEPEKKQDSSNQDHPYACKISLQCHCPIIGVLRHCPVRPNGPVWPNVPTMDCWRWSACAWSCIGKSLANISPKIFVKVILLLYIGEIQFEEMHLPRIYSRLFCQVKSGANLPISKDDWYFCPPGNICSCDIAQTAELQNLVVLDLTNTDGYREDTMCPRVMDRKICSLIQILWGSNVFEWLFRVLKVYYAIAAGPRKQTLLRL